MTTGNQRTLSTVASVAPIVLWSDQCGNSVYLERKNTFLEFTTDENKMVKRSAYPRSASADSHFKTSGPSIQSTAVTATRTNRSSSPSDRSLWSSDNEKHRNAECISPSSSVSTIASSTLDCDYDFAHSPTYSMTTTIAHGVLPCVNEGYNVVKPKSAKGEAKGARKHNLKKLNKGGAVAKDAVTTLMIRGIPCSFSQEGLISLIDDAGLKGKYDFFYLPRDGNRNSNLGYAFINFVDQNSASVCSSIFGGVELAPGRSNKTCMVAPADIQGLPNLWKHFRRTAVSRGSNAPLFLQV